MNDKQQNIVVYEAVEPDFGDVINREKKKGIKGSWLSGL